MRSNDLPDRLTQWLTPFGPWNAFNPSVLSSGDLLHVTFRAFRRGEQVKPFNAYYATYSMTGESSPVLSASDLVDLTSFADSHGCRPVADPKLFEFDGRVFATFNTGFSADTENSVYVMQVFPTLEPPQRCVLKPRHRVEKNWSFYERHGRINVLYSLDPLVRLRLAAGQPGEGASDLVFEREEADHDAAVSFTGKRFLILGKRNLSIGSQPIATDDGLLLIGHEKLYASKWRGYVGRVVRIRDLDSRPTAHVLPERLVHSVRTTLPRRGAHNREALFVTYFSGLTSVDGTVLTSYGINDVSFGFAQLPHRLLGDFGSST